MKKKMQKSSYFVKKSHNFVVLGVKWTILLFILGCTLLMCGCAKTAPEVATDAVLGQVGAVEQAIKKECPTAKIDEQINALRATVQSQLATCESQISVEQSKKRTWQVVASGLLLVMVAYFLGKSRKVI